MTDAVMQPPAENESPVLDAANMTAETVDLSRYYTLDELDLLPADALEELWQACPDKVFYENALDQAVRGEYGDAALDLDRLSIIDQSLEMYRWVPPRVPAIRRPDGSIKWFQVSDRVRQHIEDGAPLEEEAPTREISGPKVQARILVVAAMMIFVCGAGFLLLNPFGSSKPSEEELAATATAEALRVAASGETPTPTPLALDDIDRPIEAGDNLRSYYPVTLEIVPAMHPDGSRVFPVQQKQIDVARWEYDADPDVASSVYGLVIRPVLGIPYSPANSSFLNNLQPGDQIRLTMNTGQLLHFSITHSSRINRQDVSIFNQTSPGIVLVMLADPAGDRLAIFGGYPAEQETVRASTLPSDTAQAQMHQLVAHSDTGISIQVLDAYTSNGPESGQLPSAWTYLLIDLQITTANQIDTSSFQIELFDPLGGRYAPVSIDPSIAHQTPYSSSVIQPTSQQTSTLGFLVPRHLNRATLYVRTQSSAPAVAYQLQYAAPTNLSASNLDVLILGMELTRPKNDDPGQVSVTIRLFNPFEQAITVNPGDIYAIFNPTVLEDQFPVGPATQPTDLELPLIIQPGEARDITFSLQWHGEPFMGLAVGGYQYIAALQQP